MNIPILVVTPEDGPEITVDSIDVIVPITGRRKIGPRDISGLLSVIEIVSREQEKISTFYSGRDLGKVVESIVQHYHDLAVRQLSRTKEFRDDMLTWLRAIAIVLDSVSRAATHKEKDSRLRGAIDVIEGAISGLRRESFEIKSGSGSYFPFDDVFRSDYPTRELIERIRELETQLKEAGKPTANEGVPY